MPSLAELRRSVRAPESSASKDADSRQDDPRVLRLAKDIEDSMNTPTETDPSEEAPAAPELKKTEAEPREETLVALALHESEALPEGPPSTPCEGLLPPMEVTSEPAPVPGGDKKRKKRKAKKNLPVLLHIYDVSQENSVHNINKWLAHKRNPLKFGGIFHAGVEVNGLEFSFGFSDRDTVPGVSCCEPRTHQQHRYRETVTMKPSTLSKGEVGELLSQMIEEYPGDDYDLLRRNCCHFADDFCRRLGAGGIPAWVHRLARVGAGVDKVMQVVLNKRLLPDEEDYEDEME